MNKMRVRIEDEVYQDLAEFYDYNLKRHLALDEVTVLNKEQRLIASIEKLGTCFYKSHRDPAYTMAHKGI